MARMSGIGARIGGDGRAALRDAIGIFVSLRLVFGLFALYLWATAALPGPCHFEVARNGWQTIPPLADDGAAFPLVGVWQRWDACWYTKIATYGYETGEQSTNFWPLFPLLTGIAGRLLLSSMALGGLLVSGVAYVAAMTGLRRLVSVDLDDETAASAVIAISVFPTAFFFFAPFTESLFLALAVWSILGARRRLWLLAGLAALLAALTRIQGVFLVLPLAWEAFEAWRAADRRPSAGGRSSLDAILPGAAAACAPIAGFVGFLVFSAVVAGETPLDTQGAWGGTDFHPPWEVAAASWDWAVSHHDPLQAFNLFSLVLFAVVSVVGIRRIPISYSLFAIPQIALLAVRIQPTPLTSTARYLLVVFPVFVILALVKDRWLRFAWVVGSLMLLALLLEMFLQGGYVA
jgi:hypothetical protein